MERKVEIKMWEKVEKKNEEVKENEEVKHLKPHNFFFKSCKRWQELKENSIESKIKQSKIQIMLRKIVVCNSNGSFPKNQCPWTR